MARLNDFGKGKMEAPKLDPLDIKIRPGNNYREMNSPAVRAHVDWLKQSILQDGVKEPIDVEFTDGEIWLVAGECRLTAAQELRNEGWDGRIPAFATKGDEAQVLAESIIDNSGLPPTMLEFGEAVRRLVAYGWELPKVAQYVPVHVGGSPAKALRFVKDALELNQAPLAVKDAVAHGVDGVAVSPALALAATRKGRLMAPEVIKEAAGRAKAQGKAVASRPKGAGAVTKAKAAEKAKAVDLMALADKMAAAILEGAESQKGMYPGETNWAVLSRLAKQWQKGRA